jgi:N-acyl-D-aspartate/D-glutamate deacylase
VGTFPRVLGRYVRERKALTLEAAIHKMSARPAARVKLADRGRIAVGMAADLVAFDPATIIDKSTFEDPFQYPAGVELVMVNGEVALERGKRTEARTGQALKPRS